MKKFFLLVFLLPMILAGFNHAFAATRVERDLEEMKRRLELVEQATIGGGTTQGEQVEVLTRQLAEQQAEFDALRVEFQKLKGEFDDLQHTRQELHDLLNMMRSEVELKYSALEERLKKLEEIKNTKDKVIENIDFKRRQFARRGGPGAVRLR